MNRAIAVTRMHLVDRVTLFALPLGVVASAFVINILIWTQVPRDGRQTGGAASIYSFVLIVAMFAMVRGLPFALGMGASRRAFALGTGLTGGLLAVGFGTLYIVLRGLEELTDGWWLGGKFFDFPWFDRTSWGMVWLLFVISMAATFALRAWVSGLWARFGMPSLVIGGPLTILVLGGAAVLVTWQGWWTSVGHWFAGLGPVEVTGWLALLTAVLAAATWGALRRVRA